MSKQLPYMEARRAVAAHRKNVWYDNEVPIEVRDSWVKRYIKELRTAGFVHDADAQRLTAEVEGGAL